MLLSCSHIADGRASSGIFLLEFGPLDQLFLGKTRTCSAVRRCTEVAGKTRVFVYPTTNAYLVGWGIAQDVEKRFAADVLVFS